MSFSESNMPMHCSPKIERGTHILISPTSNANLSTKCASDEWYVNFQPFAQVYGSNWRIGEACEMGDERSKAIFWNSKASTEFIDGRLTCSQTHYDKRHVTSVFSLRRDLRACPAGSSKSARTHPNIWTH
jgi:hypothetical protein